MKKHIRFFVGVIFSVVLLTAGCTKQINLQLNGSVPQLTVSAFINSLHKTQTVVLSISEPYLANTPSPAALGATVNIKDSKGNSFSFVDNSNTGYYSWIPGPTDTMVHVGYSYTLTVADNGEQYQAVSKANPVPKIDSMNAVIGPTFNPKDAPSYLVSFYATDIPNRTNYYWIQGFKNDSLVNPTQVNTSIDGSMGGSAGNGLPFIYPVRTSINPKRNGGYLIGDTCFVELHAINQETYYFFQAVATQVQNGGLFAKPPANVGTNLVNVNPASSVSAVGFFNVSMTSVAGIRVKAK